MHEYDVCVKPCKMKEAFLNKEKQSRMHYQEHSRWRHLKNMDAFHAKYCRTEEKMFP